MITTQEKIIILIIVNKITPTKGTANLTNSIIVKQVPTFLLLGYKSKKGGWQGYKKIK